MIIKTWFILVAILAFTLLFISLKENKNIEKSKSTKITFILDIVIFSIIGILGVLSLFNIFNVFEIMSALIIYIIVHTLTKCIQLFQKKQ